MHFYIKLISSSQESFVIEFVHQPFRSNISPKCEQLTTNPKFIYETTATNRMSIAWPTIYIIKHFPRIFLISQVEINKRRDLEIICFYKMLIAIYTLCAVIYVHTLKKKII